MTDDWQERTALEAERRVVHGIVDEEQTQRTTVEQAASDLYQIAVAMHESIAAGRGAVGWDDARVLSILESLGR